jgi:hypothetical protein
MKTNSEVSAYRFNSTTLLLSIRTSDNCVSSLVIKYDNNEIYIDSKTKEEYEGNKLNKLLRAVVIIIAKLLYPSSQYLTSVAVNPISSHLMIKHFNAQPFDDNNKPLTIRFTNFDEMKTYFDRTDGIITKVELNDENIELAETVFTTVTHEIKCEKRKLGGNRRRLRNKKTARRNRNKKTARRSRNNKRRKLLVLAQN